VKIDAIIQFYRVILYQFYYSTSETCPRPKNASSVCSNRPMMAEPQNHHLIPNSRRCSTVQPVGTDNRFCDTSATYDNQRQFCRDAPDPTSMSFYQNYNNGIGCPCGYCTVPMNYQPSPQGYCSGYSNPMSRPVSQCNNFPAYHQQQPAQFPHVRNTTTNYGQFPPTTTNQMSYYDNCRASSRQMNLPPPRQLSVVGNQQNNCRPTPTVGYSMPARQMSTNEQFVDNGRQSTSIDLSTLSLNGGAENPNSRMAIPHYRNFDVCVSRYIYKYCH